MRSTRLVSWARMHAKASLMTMVMARLQAEKREWSELSPQEQTSYMDAAVADWQLAERIINEAKTQDVPPTPRAGAQRDPDVGP